MRGKSPGFFSFFLTLSYLKQIVYFIKEHSIIYVTCYLTRLPTLLSYNNFFHSKVDYLGKLYRLSGLHKFYYATFTYDCSSDILTILG
jgi:hypothetical protein